MVEFITAAEAAALVRPRDCVLIGGSGGGHAVPEAFIEALAAHYKESGSPRDLSLVSIVSIGDWQETGFNILAEPGLARRVVSGGFNNCPRFAAMAIAVTRLGTSTVNAFDALFASLHSVSAPSVSSVTTAVCVPSVAAGHVSVTLRVAPTFTAATVVDATAAPSIQSVAFDAAAVVSPVFFTVNATFTGSPSS